MLRCAVVAALVALGQGCGDAREAASSEVVVRVSAIAGLPEFELGPDLSGSTSAALGLIYDPIERHALAERMVGRTWVLRRRSGSPYSAAQLAASFEYEGVESSRALDNERIEISFSGAADLRWVQRYAGFDVGPFQVDHYSSERVRLRKRADVAIDLLEIVSTSANDEWRQLLAREVDVIPRAPAVVRDQFRGMSSIRVLEMEEEDSAVLYLNTARVPVDLRRHIAAAIDGKALAASVCGSNQCALADGTGAVDPLAEPATVTLDIVASESPHALAAKVLRHQLAAAGVQIEIREQTIVELVESGKNGDFDVLIAPLTSSDERFRSAVSLTRYQNPDYDAALARKDTATMQAILDRDVPIIPLFEQRFIAAVDARLCGDVVPEATSWRWIAGLRPCRAEESP